MHPVSVSKNQKVSREKQGYTVRIQSSLSRGLQLLPRSEHLICTWDPSLLRLPAITHVTIKHLQQAFAKLIVAVLEVSNNSIPASSVYLNPDHAQYSYSPRKCLEPPISAIQLADCGPLGPDGLMHAHGQASVTIFRGPEGLRQRLLKAFVRPVS